ncbi:hypothetical protein [Acetobacter vaccinii]|uniref:Uncharacterized protein n=1 Tax=Acetobacter vaccinii TaxID=2592655 RepID=A0A5C1YJZ2_9PROT|nr:hypothetical protein [Acetobacter vaccinii]QEO16556.1 hypothetical protein FLP30_01255 [Acetobacter vaccinii]
MTQEVIDGPAWGWLAGCAFMLLVQAALMVLVAPLFTGVTAWVSAVLEGQSGLPVMGRWLDIQHQFRRPGLRSEGEGLNALFGFSAFVLGVLCCALVPVFTLTIAGFPAPGLLLVCGLLVGASVLLSLPQALQGHFSASQACIALLGDGLLLPVLVPILLLAGTHDLAAFLAGLHALSPLTDGAPYVLAGVALFVVVALGPDGRETAGAMAPLAGPDRGLWLLAADCVRLCWVTLAADMAWAASLSMPGGMPAGQWVFQCLVGAVLWVCKLGVAALLLAGARLLVLPATRRVRIRLGAVFLLGLLAWQVTWAHAPRQAQSMNDTQLTDPSPATDTTGPTS